MCGVFPSEFMTESEMRRCSRRWTNHKTPYDLRAVSWRFRGAISSGDGLRDCLNAIESGFETVRHCAVGYNVGNGSIGCW